MEELVVPGAVAAERLRQRITSDGRTVFFPGVVGVAYDGGAKLLFPLVFNDDGGGDGIVSAEDSRRSFSGSGGGVNAVFEDCWALSLLLAAFVGVANPGV
ncbi:hypothetical protein PVAP13_9KG275300 [Panicum virgatum]|uniref:Uncharacterized protein n=1 Tax=Panicum virgatum TaxID=38727 RepID=A0A8T0NKT2_PANVG|nr:hypothetical protein PVAP13_9KG275300 [Panicum virgatum]